jgi:hypothetical protein
MITQETERITEWEQVRHQYPQKWLLIEALNAHSDSGKRVVEHIAVIDVFSDSIEAMKSYTEFHKKSPQRELYVFHTDRKELDISERRWLGIRSIQ